MLKHATRSDWIRYGLGGVIAFYVRSVFATTRWRLSGAEHLAATIRGEPTIIAFWHERQAMMPMLAVMARRRGMTSAVSVLVSPHRDGQLNGVVLRRLGLTPLSGSTYHGGAASFRQMLGALMRGEHVAITPDGPRGPAYRAAPGVAQLAAASGAHILPCAAQVSRGRRLRTWDRMIIPIPFGRGAMVCRPPIMVARHDWAAALPAIACAMTEAAETADRLCAS